MGLKRLMVDKLCEIFADSRLVDPEARWSATVQCPDHLVLDKVIDYIARWSRDSIVLCSALG